MNLPPWFQRYVDLFSELPGIVQGVLLLIFSFACSFVLLISWFLRRVDKE